MHIFPVETGFAPLSLYGGGAHDGHDFKVVANAPLSRVQVLVFFDSRGISACWEDSLLRLVVDYLGDTPYLALARPITMTTWATLLNLFALNRLAPALVVTNVGLVDCTPKKRSLCGDVLEQIWLTQPQTTTQLEYLEPYLLSSGTVEDLYSLNYADDYLSALRRLAAAQRTVAIKTPLVSPQLPIERARPASFFSQLQASNRLVDTVGCESVELGEFDASHTYDGVHWTAQANRMIFEKLRQVV